LQALKNTDSQLFPRLQSRDTIDRSRFHL